MDLGFLQRKSSTVLGLDISSDQVKLMELSETPQGYCVESYAIEPFPPEAMQERQIKNIEAVGLAIERVVRRSRTSLKQAAVAVTGSAVITKIIQMNAGLKESELALQVQLEAERYIPYPLSEVNLDFQVLGPSTKSPEWIDVLLAASRSENIDNLIEVLSIGGLKAKVVDIEAYAMQRAFGLIVNALPQKGDNQTVGIIDIGTSTTSFTVLHQGNMVYTRDQSFGGKQLTEEIQRRYNLSFEEANVAKKQGGLPEDYRQDILEPFEDAIVQQIGRSLQFLFSSTPYTEVNQLVLAGGSACLPGLVQKVKAKLECPTLLANPFQAMSVSPRVSVPSLQADAPSLMICCGLALRSFII